MHLDAETCCCGLDAVDDILKAVGFAHLVKALDPLDPRDFLVLVERLAQRLTGKAKPTEQAALKAALQELDVNWAELSATAREQAIKASTIALDAAKRGALPHVQQAFELQGPKVAANSKAATVRRFDLDIEATLSQTDRNIAEHVVKSQAAFVTDAYGRRSVAWSERARVTVARGLEEGLGRTDIASNLSRMTGAAELARTDAYWRVVASAFVGRARAGTQVSAFAEAKIERFMFRAVLDMKTTDICRFLDGKTWSTARAMETLQRVTSASEPEQIRYLQPWVERGKDADGDSILYFNKPDGSRQVVADVIRSGIGRADDRGEFKARMSDGDLESSGMSIPPLHRTCRSIIVTLT